MLQKILTKSTLYLKRRTPTILTCLGAVGVVSTSVMAVKATPKAMTLLRNAEKEKGEELTKLETVKIAVPVFIPSAIVGLSTIACIFGLNVLNQRNQATLACAYALLNESYQRYRKAAVSVYGEDADFKIRSEAAKDIFVSADGLNLYLPETDSSEKVLFFESYSQRYFTSTMASVLNAQYHLNRNLTLRGEATVNEFYTFLGIEELDCGYDVGWSLDGLMDGFTWLDFENRHVETDDGLECYIVSAMFNPEILR